MFWRGPGSGAGRSGPHTHANMISSYISGASRLSAAQRARGSTDSTPSPPPAVSRCKEWPHVRNLLRGTSTSRCCGSNLEPCAHMVAGPPESHRPRPGACAAPAWMRAGEAGPLHLGLEKGGLCTALTPECFDSGSRCLHLLVSRPLSPLSFSACYSKGCLRRVVLPGSQSPFCLEKWCTRHKL